MNFGSSSRLVTFALAVSLAAPAFGYNRLVCDAKLTTSVVTAIGRDGSEFALMTPRVRRTAVTEKLVDYVQIRNLDAKVVAKIYVWDLIEIFKKRDGYTFQMKTDGTTSFELKFAPSVAKELEESLNCRGEF